MQTTAPDAALLIVDVQKGFDEPVWGRRNNPQMEQRIVELLNVWRASKRLVIHVKHMSDDSSSPLHSEHPGNDFKPEVSPIPGELIIEKRVNSCFIGTSLQADLWRRGQDSLVIAGLTTNHCVSTTTRMAQNLGFNVCVVSDATATFDRVGPDGIRHTAEEIQAIALCDLHGEFATVVDTRTIIDTAHATGLIANKECAS